MSSPTRQLAGVERHCPEPIAVRVAWERVASRRGTNLLRPFLQRGRPVLRRFSDAGTHDANHALRRPASEKRQGTKSRWGIVGGAATMGISSRAQASMWWNVAARGEILPRGICVN